MDVMERSVDDEDKFRTHPVGVVEPQAVECPEVINRASARSPVDQPLTGERKRVGRCRCQRNVVEMAAVEDGGQRRAVRVAGDPSAGWIHDVGPARRIA